ncbi:C-type mannose receptor 2-like [Onychostoma macrolepis]|uniref:C-type mannose receptor 2-like n=1 Tax=Onychostoma macrolepis TaxID=369639 RepID=UPI00272B4E90|nr:C-type mannose receptor 2-like [Onychostoma macrolepis]
MERITLLSLLLTVVVSSSPRQYHFVNQKMNWTEAQSYCREKHTDLVTINNIQEQNDIKQLLNSNSDRVWIGLKDAWIWSLSDSDFYRGDESQYRNWKPGQPSGDGDCVYMNNDGQWNDKKCNTQKHFICYNGSSKGFVPVQELKNWTEAQKYCRQKHTDLASVRNQSENHQIQNIINQSLTSPHQAWIGLYRFWVWSDNSNFIFKHWKQDEPNNKATKDSICASTGISDKGRWTDEYCRESHPFVCYDDKLVLIRENKTWPEALRYCRERDMDLVSVDSEQMQRWVKILFMKANASSAHVWLGLRHSRILELWFWVSGHTMCYDQWAPDYDTGLDDCVITVRSGAIRTRDQLWISRPETEENNFICIKPQHSHRSIDFISNVSLEKLKMRIQTCQQTSPELLNECGAEVQTSEKQENLNKKMEIITLLSLLLTGD